MTAIDQTEQLVLGADAQNLLFREARTANSFSDEPVTDEQIQAIYDLVKWAPTSMNQQPLRIVLVRSEEGKQRLLPHLMEGNRVKTEKAPLVAILAADTDFHENLPRVFPHAEGVREMFAGNEELRLTNAKLNASLQIAYFILGVRAAGLVAGPMTGFDKAGLDAEFFPGGNQQALVVVNIGKPGENPWFDRLPRLDYDEVVTTV
ncbi:malonic semialdehyde reductase [Saccharopolyspora sp. NPDC050389]|uniref:malonic semialdehyde reductase n=1 Tax=Saccharopolyspora sp. NPDC050389 TaxID=3155516 RepID=UPI0033CF8CEE